jgi:hemoglobin-like flavoprotein
MQAELSSHYCVTESLTVAEIRLIRDAYDRLSVGRRFAHKFYGRLFELAPEIRTLFSGDMSQQVAKLTEMLAILVGKLDKPYELAAVLRDLGSRHRAYGVGVRHFAPVGRALFDTLAGELGPGFDEPMRRAWIALYALASSWMQHSIVGADGI